MEVSNVTPVALGFDDNMSSRSALPTKSDMEMDMDVDLALDEDLSTLEAEAMTITTRPTQTPPAVANPNGAPSPDAGPSDATHPTPHKVHIRGLDNLHTNDINGFASEYFTSAQPTRIEWIDDTSANIVYDTPATAMKALASFSLPELQDATSIPTMQLRALKAHPTHPDSRLEARLAVMGDRKQPGARERSRYYLFNPDHDAVEQRTRGGRGRRGGSRHNDDNANYRRRRYDDREHRRRRDEDEDAGFDASLYDDDADTVAAREGRRRRLGSRSSISSAEGDRHVRFAGGRGKELFPDRVGTKRSFRLRDRSASPDRNADRDGDEDMGLDAGESRAKRRNTRERSYTPPSRRNRHDQSTRLADSNTESASHETGSKDISMDLRGGPRIESNKELFPNKSGGNHRRSGAFDAADETADLFAGRMAVPFTDGAADRRGKRFADRISAGPVTPSLRLEDRITTTTAEHGPAEEVEGINIRGAAKQLERGFSIRGAASGSLTGDGARELFPGGIASNAGKELFAEKLDGRGGKRRRAEDMFY